MNKEVNLELLESYLAGDISADKVLDREDNVLTTEELEVAVEEYQDVLIHMEGAALKEELRNIQAAMEKQPPKPTYRLWYRVAASILILVTAGVLWQNMNSAPEFGDYFEHFPQLRTFRTGDEQTHSEGMEAYSRRSYSEAYSLLSETSTTELDAELKFYLAVSALWSDYLSEATDLLEELKRDEGNKYYQQINWYLALAYWKGKHFDKAIDQLKMIKKGQFNYQEAQKLMNDLS